MADLDGHPRQYESSTQLLNDPALLGFDLLLLDMVIPGEDGLACLRALRAQGFSGRIVLISAGWDGALLPSVMAAGADDYLVKTSLIELLPSIVSSIA